QNIPLEELAPVDAQELFSGVQRVDINGALSLQGSFRLEPSLQPESALPGQLYFDQDSNTLAYYNGEEYVQLTDQGDQFSQSIGGLTGSVALGPGLVAAGGVLNNSGVLSLQGQTGAVTL